MKPSRRVIQGSDGLRLSVAEWASEAPATCLLVHGFGATAGIWAEFARTARRELRVAAIDLRGHGASDWHPTHRYEHVALVDDLEAVAAEFPQPLCIVGHSLGARIAAGMAARWPGVVSGLVLVDAGPRLQRSGTDRIVADFRASVRTYASKHDYERTLAGIYRLASSEMIRTMADTGLARREDGAWEPTTDPAFTVHRDDRSADEFWWDLGQVECPTLVVRGEASAVLERSIAQEMACNALRSGELVEIPAAGHAVPIDNPEAFANATLAFLRRVPPGA